MTALPCQQGVKSNQLVTTAKANRKKNMSDVIIR